MKDNEDDHMNIETRKSSNWAQLRAKIPRKAVELEVSPPEKLDNLVISEPSVTSKSEYLRQLESKMRKKIVGLDCEMVGLGVNGKTNALARCSVVDFNGKVLYDQIIRPKGYVTDFRTKWSGIKRSDLRKDKENVVTFEECQESVAKILKGKILVGHALENDLSVLLLSHPRHQIRDTGRYPPYMRRKINSRGLRPRSLKELTLQYLGKKIQSGEHDSVEDARCAVELYRRAMENWEKWLQEKKKGKQSKKIDNKPEKDQNIEENIEFDEPELVAGSSENEQKISDLQYEISKEELQPQKKKLLSIKAKLNSSIISTVHQLIEEAKRVDNYVDHHHTQITGKKKRKFSVLSESESEAFSEAPAVVVFEKPENEKPSQNKFKRFNSKTKKKQRKNI